MFGHWNYFNLHLDIIFFSKLEKKAFFDETSNDRTSLNLVYFKIKKIVIDNFKTSLRILKYESIYFALRTLEFLKKFQWNCTPAKFYVDM